MVVQNRIAANGRFYYRRFVWTREVMFRIIDGMKEEPMLWNPQHSDYKARGKKQAALKRLASTVHLPTDVVRHKIAILKSSFHKYHRESLCKQTPVKWFAYERLSFLASIGTSNGRTDKRVMKQTITTSAPTVSTQVPLPPQGGSPGTSAGQSRRSGDGGLMNCYPDWAVVMGSYVTMMVNGAGQRPEMEMRRLHQQLISVMEIFQDGAFAEQEHGSPLCDPEITIKQE